MTNKEKEEFIGHNFQNLAYLNNGYYHCRWLIVPSNNYTKFELYEDTEYQTNANVFSHDTNYAIYENLNFDNGNVVPVFRMDITFLFDDNFISDYGCPNLEPSEQDTHNVYFVQTINTSDEQLWVISDNGVINEDYNVHRASLLGSTYYAYTEDRCAYGCPFDSLGQAQNLVISEYIKDGYPSGGSDNVYTRYNQPLRDYVDCITQRVDQCCLLSCW